MSGVGPMNTDEEIDKALRAFVMAYHTYRDYWMFDAFHQYTHAETLAKYRAESRQDVLNKAKAAARLIVQSELP